METIDVVGNLLAVRKRIDSACVTYHRGAADVELLAVSKTKPEQWSSRPTTQAKERSVRITFKRVWLRRKPWHIWTSHGTSLDPFSPTKRGWLRRHSTGYSVDREKIAHRLSAARPTQLPDLNVCLQVNVSSEASKSGLMAAEVAAMADLVSAMPRIRLRGLMAIPAPVPLLPNKDCRLALRELFSSLHARHPNLDTLSMGMSGDLEAAIAEGATVVRIGTDIFGSRATGRTHCQLVQQRCDRHRQRQQIVPSQA